MTTDAIAAWRAAGEHRDVALLDGWLADDVQLISPLTAQFRFAGLAQVTELMRCAYEVIDEIRFHTQISADATAALFLHGRCGRERFEEAQLLRLRESRIEEITFFGRPLPGLTAIMAAIGPTMARRQGRTGLARLLRGVTAPLAVAIRVGDQRVVPLAAPSRGERSSPHRWP